MSWHFVGAPIQDFETDTAPFTLAGGASRDAGSLMTGTHSLRCDGSPAADATAIYTPATAERDLGGAGMARRLGTAFDFKVLTRPVGGLCSMMVMLNPSVVLYVRTDGKLELQLAGVAAVVGPTVLTTGTAYRIETLSRFHAGGASSADDRYDVDVWINDVPEASAGSTNISASDAFGQVYLGVTGGLGKLTYDFAYDQMQMWHGRDPS